MTIVRVIRRQDPLEGQQVQVLRRWRRKHGGVDLLVMLPNGRKRLVPQTWTDADPAGETDTDGRAATMGTVADLVAAVVIVSALSRRESGEQAASQSTCEEDIDAARPAQSAPRTVPAATTGAAVPASRSRGRRSDPPAGTSDRQGVRRERGAL